MTAAADIRKRLVICCDGTWNNADTGKSDTNVTLFSRAVRATTGTGDVLQAVLYLRGVGTTGLDITQKIDGATGLGIDDNIKSAYTFLAQNYVPGDEIFLLGFSRGAFTARSIVGLIAHVGILKRQSLRFLGDAWRYYRDRDTRKDPQDFLARTPGADSHVDASIAFLGVWETVGALGFPGHLFDHINHRLYGFYDTSLCPIVRRAYHALAADEHRSSFVPTLWTGTVPARCEEIQQLWFAGAHSDVGGGYTDRTLADIPLLWMARNAERAGLVIDWSCLPEPGASQPLAARHDSSNGVFSYDRFLPTEREICGQPFALRLGERRYVPEGDNGAALPILNEALHESLVSRFRRTCGYHPDGDAEKIDTETYAPRNVAATFGEDGQLKPGIIVIHQSDVVPDGVVP